MFENSLTTITFEVFSKEFFNKLGGINLRLQNLSIEKLFGYKNF